MKTVQRKEVIKFYQIINHDEPVAVMSFRPPLIGVFTNQDALDSALKKKELNTVYTTTNTVKRESLKKLPRNKFATMTSNNSISANDIKEFRYFFVDIDVVGLRENDDRKRNATDEEHAEAEEVAKHVRKFLDEKGFPNPIFIDSGNGKKITYNLKSDEFRYYMRGLLKNALKIKIFASKDWRELLDYLEVVASTNKESVSIYNRVGQKDENILYDLQTADYKSVCITKGDYSIVDTPAGVFQRADLDLPQIEPIFDAEYDFWGKMEELFNFRSRQELELFVLWLISTYIPDIAHPILLLTGPHGSSKSTASSMIQALVSPQKMERSTFPRKVSDLVIRLANRCICVFDNCSKLNLDASDALCSCATGGNYEKRKLYTDSQMISIPLKSCVVLNSCETLIERPDLLSRTLQFNLQTLKELDLEYYV